MSEAPTVERLRSVTTVSVREGGAFIGLSAASAYRAAADGSLPTVTLGKTLRVPTPKLLALVGLPYETTTKCEAPSSPVKPLGDSHEQALPGSPDSRVVLRSAAS